MNSLQLLRTYENHLIRKYRLDFTRKKTLSSKMASINVQQISKECENVIKSFWNKWYTIKKGSDEYKWFCFYHTLRPNDNVELFIPDNLFYAYVDTHFNDFRPARSLDDKNFYNLFFGDAQQPETIIRKIKDSYLDKNYQIISLSKAIQLCNAAKYVIIKPSIGTEGGKGIEFWEANSANSEHLLTELLSNNNDVIVQRVIKQHPILSELHSNSINTIRIMTLFFENETHILSSVLRIGANGSRVDNVSSGGMACGINADGRLKKMAYNVKGESFLKHPQGAVFENYCIPDFDKCKKMVNNLAPRISRISKLVSWDIAIMEDSTPLLIEVNLSYGQLDFHQMCNGPIFGENTERILNVVFPKKKNPYFK